MSFKKNNIPWNKGKKHSDEMREKLKKAHRILKGEKSRHWKGGKSVNHDGYIRVYCPDHPNARGCYVFEHRIKMEKKLGRYLNSDEVVHHKNGIKDDNRLTNLVLMKKPDHDRLSLLERRKENV